MNDSTKNAKERIEGERYELHRNFKRTDSPAGTDLSARSSFAKRAREVKATNEVAVFKEDYPRDDKSVEDDDDEWPDRSRVSNPSGTYRRIVPDGEKCGEEITRRNLTFSRIIDQKNFKKPYSRDQTEIISGNMIAPKMKRKRISRGVQYEIPAGQGSSIGPRFLLGCCSSGSNQTRPNLTRKMKGKIKIPKDKETLEKILSQNQGDASLATDGIINDMKSDEHYSNKAMTGLRNNMDLTTEMSESERAAAADVKDHKIKKSDRFKRLIRIFARKDNQYASAGVHRISNPDDFPVKGEAVECSSQDKTMSNDHEREGDDPRGKGNIKMFHRKSIVSNDTWRSANVNSDESDACRARRRLDSCIAELNEIVGDACAIFGSGSARAARRNGMDGADGGRVRMRGAAADE